MRMAWAGVVIAVYAAVGLFVLNGRVSFFGVEVWASLPAVIEAHGWAMEWILTIPFVIAFAALGAWDDDMGVCRDPEGDLSGSVPAGHVAMGGADSRRARIGQGGAC